MRAPSAFASTAALLWVNGSPTFHSSIVRERGENRLIVLRDGRKKFVVLGKSKDGDSGDLIVLGECEDAMRLI
ncbi:hypothetical protein AJ87_49390 [Rhizobium yanglingense]|nr:hypothetical protein AJ87_49390 [Rhizobium yanglingense]